MIRLPGNGCDSPNLPITDQTWLSGLGA